MLRPTPFSTVFLRDRRLRLGTTIGLSACDLYCEPVFFLPAAGRVLVRTYANDASRNPINLSGGLSLAANAICTVQKVVTRVKNTPEKKTHHRPNRFFDGLTQPCKFTLDRLFEVFAATWRCTQRLRNLLGYRLQHSQRMADRSKRCGQPASEAPAAAAQFGANSTGKGRP